MQNLTTSPRRPVEHLVVTWVLIVPLFYFASAGTLWFQGASDNSSLSAIYGSLTSESMTGYNVTSAICIYALVFGLVCSMSLSAASVWHEGAVFMCLAALALSSAVWSQFPVKSLEYALCLTGSTVFSIYLCRRFSPERLLSLLIVLGWICLTSSIILCTLFPRIGVDRSVGSTGAWRGIYLHKNLCSMMTVMLMPASIYAPTAGPLSKLGRAAYVGLSMFLVVMTQARTGWVLLASLLCSVAALKLIGKSNRQQRAVTLIFGGVISLVLVSLVVLFANNIFYLLGKDPTITGRTEIWKAVLPAIGRHVFLGYGYNGFWRGYRGESANVELTIGFAAAHAHNGFLDIALSLGVLGVGVVIYSLIRALRDLAVCLCSGKKSYFQWYACIVVLFVVVNLDEAELAKPNDLIWILYVIACVGLSEGAKRIRLGQSYA